MSQRKAKEYRRAMGQYKGMAEDVDDLKRRIGSMEARHRREDQADEAWRKAWSQKEAEAQRIRAERSSKEQRKRAERNRWKVRRKTAVVVCAAIVMLAIMWAIAMTCAAQESTSGLGKETGGTAVDSLLFAACAVGEDPMEAEKIEAALLAQGYYSDEVPMTYDLQDIMRTACEQYGCPYALALAVAEVESGFDLDAVGAAGEVGIMQLNPGPENGVTSTEHSEKVMKAMDRWEEAVG